MTAVDEIKQAVEFLRSEGAPKVRTLLPCCCCCVVMGSGLAGSCRVHDCR